jgi:phosphoserine phosphatase RsbU/P
MRLVVVKGDDLIGDLSCGQEAVFVGSREGCRVHLAHPGVPEQHAVLYPDRGGWVVERLDDGCELLLNDAVIADKAELKDGDEIRILEFALKIQPDLEERAEERAAPARVPGTSRAALERFAQMKALPMGTVLRKPEEPVTARPEVLPLFGRASAAMAGCTTIEELIDAVLKLLLEMTATQRAWVGVRRVNYGAMEYEEGRTSGGQMFDLPEVGQNLKPRVLDRGQGVYVPIISSQERVSVLCGPLCGPDGMLGMVYLDSGDSGRRFEAQDLDFLTILLTAIAFQLDGVFKGLARNKMAMIEGQVSVAHEIQARITPRKLPQSDQLQFGAFRETGHERAGDVYDVVRLANNRVAVMVAQTPAAGALPSMLLAQAQTAFRIAAMHQDAPQVFLRSLNWLQHDGQRDHPLHCFAGVLDPATGQLQYSIAGHVGCFIISARGEDRSLAPLEPAAELGASKATVYPCLTGELESGETLVLFTAGVTTATNKKNEPFGEARFVNILCDGFGQLASATMKEMLTDLRSFTEGGSQPDDITVLLAHRV